MSQRATRYALLALAIAFGPERSGHSAENAKTPGLDSNRPTKAIKRLTDVISPSMDIAIMNSVAESSLGLTVEVPNYPVDTKRRRCILPAPKTRASVNGIAMTRIRGAIRSSNYAYDRDCAIEFGFGPPIAVKTGSAPEPVQMGRALLRSTLASERALVQIEDDRTRWTYEIPEAFADRRLSFEMPQSGTLTRGHEVLLRWSPSSDRLGEHVIVEIERNPTARQEVPATAEGNRISFIVPSDLAGAFDGPVAIRLRATVVPATGACPVSTCRVLLDAPTPSVSGLVETTARAAEKAR